MNAIAFEALPQYTKYKAKYIGMVLDDRFSGETRFSREPDGHVFVYAKRQHTHGWRTTEDWFLAHFEPILDTPEEQTRKWHKHLQKGIACMTKSGLWPELVETYRNLLTMPYSDWHAARDQFWDARTVTPDLIAKYPFLANADSQYFEEVAKARMKKMYFGNTFEGEMQKRSLHTAMEARKDYYTGRVCAGYDVSAEYKAKERKGWYSEEYRNCGNGHYYLMLDKDYAVFYEDD